MCGYQKGYICPRSASSSDAKVKAFMSKLDNGEIRYYNVPVEPNSLVVFCLNNQNASAVQKIFLPTYCISNSRTSVSYTSYPYVLCQTPRTYAPTYQVAYQTPLVFYNLATVQS